MNIEQLQKTLHAKKGFLEESFFLCLDLAVERIEKNSNAKIKL